MDQSASIERPVQISITIISEPSVGDYAVTLTALLESQGLSVRRTSPYSGPPPVEALGNPAHLFQGSDYLIILLSIRMWEYIYAIPGYRASIDAVVRKHSSNVFVVLTDNIWIPGIVSKQVFIDLHARNATPVAAEILTLIGADPTGGFEKMRLSSTDIIRATPDESVIREYLSKLCVLSDYAGVIAFGVVLYEDGQVELTQTLMQPGIAESIDLAAGPHLDLFAIADRPVTGTALGNPDGPEGPLWSKFIEEFLGIQNVQTHYPSLMLFLIERQQFTNTALIPIFFVETKDFPQRLQALAATIADGLRMWRLNPYYAIADVWSHLMKSLRQSQYACTEFKTPIATGSALDLFAKYIRYF